MTPPNGPLTTPKAEVELRVGYPGNEATRKFTVPDGDAPPWDLRTPHRAAGTDVDRIDGLAKASGRAKYTYDVTFPGLLHAVILRSPVARGKLRNLELDDARKAPGIGAVIALKEIGARVRFVGDAVAAVAGVDLESVRDAIERIRADYDAEQHVVDFLETEDAPELDADGQATDPWPPQAELDAAFAGVKTTHEATYRTEVQTHSSLETHGAVAKWTGKDLDVWSSTQSTFGVRGELARALEEKGLKPDSVTVHAEFVGGGFGSKFGAGIEGLACCLLAHEAKAPVKLMLDRFEEHTCTGNRPAALMRIRAGLDAEGKVVAWDCRTLGGVGFNRGGGNIVLPAHYVERLDRSAKRQVHADVATDTDPARPMRAPGWPQGYFGGELFLDELAAKAGVDPLALRLANDPQPLRLDQWKKGAERFGWAKARAAEAAEAAASSEQRWLRGVGCASARWGGMGSPGRPPHGITCRIHADGTVEVRSGAQDIGTGMKTVMAILAADELGLRPEQVKVAMGTTTDPSGPGSGGSTTTPSLAPAVRHAVHLGKQALAERVGKHLGIAPEKVEFADGKVGAGAPMLAWAEACKLIGPNPIEGHGVRHDNYKGEHFQSGVCGVQFAEVLVDSWTGLVRVTRMLALQDCGVVIAKKLAESQVLGAMIQGVSYALHEQRILDRRTGRMLNGDFLRYKILGPEDLPELEVEMQSVVTGHTNTSSVGLGEPPAVAAPAAVANAVFHALGVPVRHLPITPDKVLAALAQRRGGAR